MRTNSAALPSIPLSSSITKINVGISPLIDLKNAEAQPFRKGVDIHYHCTGTITLSSPFSLELQPVIPTKHNHMPSPYPYYYSTLRSRCFQQFIISSSDCYSAMQWALRTWNCSLVKSSTAQILFWLYLTGSFWGSIEGRRYFQYFLSTNPPGLMLKQFQFLILVNDTVSVVGKLSNQLHLSIFFQISCSEICRCSEEATKSWKSGRVC